MKAGRMVNGYAIHPGANLERAYLGNVDLRGTHLTSVNLTSATLTDANLTYIVWRRTTCPDGTITDTGCSAPPAAFLE